MTPTTFVSLLSHELRLRGMPVFRAELQAWVTDAWPLIADDPSPGRWAAAYAETHAVAEGAD